MHDRIAFFGLGAMGMPMAENLLKAGYAVHSAVHRSAAAAEDLSRRYGLGIFPTAAEAAAEADIIITILPADHEVKSFLMSDKLAAALKPGAVIVDMSSCTSEAIREVADWYAPKDIKVVDAPVSGGVAGAVKGALSIFAAGEPQAIAQVRPVLETMGNRIFELGECGMGKAFKNLNNLLLAANVMIMSEVFHAARQQGVDMDRFFEVVCASSGASAAFTNRFKRMVNKDFAGGFKLSLAQKDVGNALALGGDVPMPVSKLVYELMRACSDYGALDLSAVCKLFETDSK